VVARINAGQHRAARRVATRALELHGDDAALRCARGVARFATDDVRGALEDLEAALALDPASRCARRNLSLLSGWRGDHERARALGPPGSPRSAQRAVGGPR
jgi:Flp pilus assembly protein TadD